jgi:hypothetical protein
MHYTCQFSSRWLTIGLFYRRIRYLVPIKHPSILIEGRIKAYTALRRVLWEGQKPVTTEGATDSKALQQLRQAGGIKLQAENEMEWQAGIDLFLMHLLKS